jgi:hypothetical protein
MDVLPAFAFIIAFFSIVAAAAGHESRDGFRVD